MDQQTIADLGAKLSAEVTAAFRRAPGLADDPEAALKVACYGLVSAFGATVALACVATGDTSEDARKEAARELTGICQRALT